MIKDVLVIKDGLPLFSKNFTSSRNFISNHNNLIMVSGFLSALNSFSEEFEDMGSIKELKLSNSNLRLAFLKNNTIPNLIFLASFDEESSSVNVQRFLRKISYTFLKKYNINQITNWDGRADRFHSFVDIVQNYIEDESTEQENDFKEKIVDLFEEIREKLDGDDDYKKINKKHSKEGNSSFSKFCNLIPELKISNNINPNFFLTGKLSKNIIKKINGKKSIDYIAQELDLSQVKVYNICKNLVKLGFISLEN
ncbi:MAG: hypothetical protein KGD57_07415 [Candidatus Lokiarchaeota archaeon]|nr:hypothetical protein [Candidatus Lokiarchaeota archaeon]